jgi:hypothetical protein
MFCALRDFYFSFETSWTDSGFVMLDTSSSRIAPDVRARVITMRPGAPSPPAAECGGIGVYLEPGGAERRAIASSKGMIQRVGDTLVVHAANGAQATFLTHHQEGAARVAYEYAGTLANGTLHRIEVTGPVASWTEYVVARTGRTFRTAGEPVISPDGTRVASSYYAMEACEFVPRLEILRLADGGVTRELEIEPRDCDDAGSGWAARDLQWLSPDTLAFMADSNRPADTPRTSPLDTSRYVSRPMLAIRSGGDWVILRRR